ncbi:hypothetical protein OH77DRAFT_1427769 [Trametes cingulata]|nr:hypothetical protein OH77DRAFT_1427769 [Trametes cingulata]
MPAVSAIRVSLQALSARKGAGASLVRIEIVIGSEGHVGDSEGCGGILRTDVAAGSVRSQGTARVVRTQVRCELDVSRSPELQSPEPYR